MVRTRLARNVRTGGPWATYMGGGNVRTGGSCTCPGAMSTEGCRMGPFGVNLRESIHIDIAVAANNRIIKDLVTNQKLQC